MVYIKIYKSINSVKTTKVNNSLVFENNNKIEQRNNNKRFSQIKKNIQNEHNLINEAIQKYTKNKNRI